MSKGRPSAVTRHRNLMFPACPCDLLSTCDTPRIRGRFPEWSLQKRNTKDAFSGEPLPLLVVLGEAPGPSEDKEGTCFVGPSGKLLSIWLTTDFPFQNISNIYLTNAVHCKPPGDLPDRAYKKCWPNTERELKSIFRRYKGETYLLCVGATAVKAVRGISLTESFKSQGTKVKIAGRTCNIFTTYHPAYTLPGRNPQAFDAVYDHLSLLYDVMTGETTITTDYGTDYEPKYRVKVPDYPVDLLSIDLETYGIRKGLTQTQFHPRKMYYLDGIRKEKIIETAAIAWQKDGVYHTACFNMQNKSQVRLFMRHLEHADRWLFKNTSFDLSVLMYVLGIQPHSKPIWDVDIDNYLDSDVRPERSLKSLSTLMGLPSYKEGGFTVHDDPCSHEAMTYVTKDALDTLLIHHKLRARILDRYGPQSSKLSDFTWQWYSDLLWECTEMSMVGVPMDGPRLVQLQKDYESKISDLNDSCKETYGFPLRGPGSGKGCQLMVDEACDVHGLTDHEDLQRSNKTNLISTSEDNLNLLLANLPPGRHVDYFLMLQKFRDLNGVLTRYLNKLVGPFKWDGKNKRMDRSSCLFPNESFRISSYPRWNTVPAGANKDDNTTKGTKQGRITAVNPPIQTYPELIKHCISPLYEGGYFMYWDLSQIELRIGALISGDSRMMGEYEKGVDRHTDRAIEAFGPDIVNHPEFRSLYRQGGKTFNFSILYQGGAYIARLTFRKDLNFEAPIEFFQKCIDQNNARYPEYMKWVSTYVREATRRGYIEDPITGAGRRVTTSQLTNEKMTPMIVNLPIQCAAAYTLLSSQMWLSSELRRLSLKSRVILNVYDAMGISGPPEELEMVRGYAYNSLDHSEYFKRLCDHYGRTVPLLAEDEILS